MPNSSDCEDCRDPVEDSHEVCAVVSAHRTLDVDVAVKVMGWRARAFSFGHAWYDVAGAMQEGINWSPSTDIAAAWLVQEKLQETEWELSLDYEAPKGAGGQGWCATFGHHLRDATFAYASTAPLAICRAALATITR